MASRCFLLVAVGFLAAARAPAQGDPAEPDDAKYRKAAEGIVLPPEEELKEWAAKGKNHKEIIDWITNRGNWAQAFRTIEEKLGLFEENPEVRIAFTRQTGEYEMTARGEKARGYIRVNIDSVAGLLPHFKAGNAPGRSLGQMLTHELVHTFQGFTSPLWLVEGWAEYAGGGANIIYTTYGYGKAEVGTVTDVRSAYGAYARGPLFFYYLEKVHGPEKLKKFVRGIIVDGKKIGESAEDATGKKWDEFLEDEREWSRRWVEDFRERLRKKKK